MIIQGTDKMKVIYVEWEDAASREGWISKEEAHNATNVICSTVGFLVKKTRVVTILAASISDELYGDIWTIPTKNIVKLEVLKTVKTPKLV